MAKHSPNILELAKRGAEYRYQELKAELASLVRHFPHLRTRGPIERVKRAIRRRRRRKMSAAARRAISQRMKKLWAARRKGK